MAAMIVVVLDPWAMLASGFWLSFCAVAVLIACGARLAAQAFGEAEAPDQASDRSPLLGRPGLALREAPRVDRERVAEGKGVSRRVDEGGRRIIKKKKHNK